MNENIYSLPEILRKDFESFHTLFQNENILIEKIISTGQRTPDNQWLQQEKSEWVILIRGKAGIRLFNEDVRNLIEGDFIHIPKNTKHRVEYTSSEPVCIWLAVHFT